MKQLRDGKKVIEPTEIQAPGTWGNRFAINVERMKDTICEPNDPHYFDAYLYSLGYTKNPATCHHDRKKITDSTFRWRCMDCGTFVI